MTVFRPKKRALLLLGAGASVEFGVPATPQLTQDLAAKVHANPFLQRMGAHKAYEEIAEILGSYYQNGATDVNFEQIFHCAHELLFTFPPTNGAVNEYRPTLYPFLKRGFEADYQSLRALADGLTKLVYRTVSEACDRPKSSTHALARFVERIRADYVTRIYTTNYDDFVLQAAPDLFTGFGPATKQTPGAFEAERFWDSANRDALFHLHGSVHLGFVQSVGKRWAELVWYPDREEAIDFATYSGSDDRRMDGSTVSPTSIVTGLDKLSRLQQMPFSYYYSSLGQDALQADLIFVIGCGLGDLHLNNWFHEARLKRRPTPIILVDYWEGGFVRSAAFNETDRKLLEIWHTLRMVMGFEPCKDDHSVPGYTIDAARTAAIWGGGFQSFLNAATELDTVLATFHRSGAPE